MNHEWLNSIQGYVISIGDNKVENFEKFLPVMTRHALEEKCKKIRDAGFNSVMPMFAHYRWDFLPHLDRIIEFFNDLTEIGHQQDLKVWEHHSVVLWSKVIPGAKYKKWQLDKLLKIDVRTGTPYDTGYQAVGFCCNNPYFRDAYFDLAARLVVEIPVDLYMPDDMSAANDYYDCDCRYCHQLFKKTTGYAMPPRGSFDKRFYGNMNNPVWRAWIRFRSTRVGLFLRALREFLATRGRGELPMTTCNCESLPSLARVQGGDHQEINTLAGLDLGFHEIWGESFYNWPRGIVERQVNRAVGDYCNIPYISHSYPLFQDEAAFNFFQEMATGMTSNFTVEENVPLNHEYQAAIKFSTTYRDIIYAGRPVSNIGIVFSRNSRDFYGEDILSRTNQERHSDELAGWCENILKMNQPYRILPESLVEDAGLSEFTTVILPNCACMSECMATQLAAFVEAGGTLIATHETSLFDATGNKLPNFQLAKVFGFDYLDTARGYNYPIMQNYCQAGEVIYRGRNVFQGDRYDPKDRDALFKDIGSRRIPHHGPMVLIKPKSAQLETLAHTPIVHDLRSGYAAVVLHRFGKGRVLYFNGLPGLMNHSIGTVTSPQYGEDPLEVIDETIPEYEGIIRNCVQWAMEESFLLSLEPQVKGLVVNFRASAAKDRHFLHLLATPIRPLSPDGRHRLHRYFPVGPSPAPQPLLAPRLEYGEMPELKISVNQTVLFHHARLISPDFSGEKELTITSQQGHRTLHVPAGAFSRYAVIEFFQTGLSSLN